MARTATQGVVYLLHFDRPYRHARHYTGFATELDARLEEHAERRGARLLAVITEQGIGWQLARTWSGTRARERQLKNQGGASRRCPLCGHPARTTSSPPHPAATRSAPLTSPTPQSFRKGAPA